MHVRFTADLEFPLKTNFQTEMGKKSEKNEKK